METKKRAAELLAEFNHPSSVVSRYVPPITIPRDDDDQRIMTGMESPIGSNSHSEKGPFRGLASTGRKGMHVTGATTSAVSSTSMIVPGSQTARPAHHHSSRPYHSPLQRQLLSLYPQYTERELTLHSKFTPTFYLGPPCRSLDDSGVAAVGVGGNMVRYTTANDSVPQPDRAGYTIGANQLASTTATQSVQQAYSTLPSLDADQRALLQSAFDRVDEVFPLPGQPKQGKDQTVKQALEQMNSHARIAGGLPGAAGPGSVQPNPLHTADLHVGLKRQLVPRAADPNNPQAAGNAGEQQQTYDVFHLPYGFKVVRDDSVDPRSWGGGTGNKPGAEAPSDAAVKSRVRGALMQLADKYKGDAEEKSSSGVHPTLIGDKVGASALGQPQPTTSNATTPAAAVAMPLPSGLSTRRPTIKHPSGTDSLLPFHSPTSASSGQPPKILTAGPDIEYVFPQSSATGVNRAKDATSSVGDIGERNMLELEFDPQEDAQQPQGGKRGRKAKSPSRKQRIKEGIQKGSTGPVVGRAVKLSSRIPPSRGTQLLNKLSATVRCCCLVPATGHVWTAQRDPVLVIRDRMTGKVIHRLDTPSLIWCMLLLDGVMWMGTETGVILAFSITSFKLLRQATDHSGGIHCLTRGIGNSGVFSGSNDFTMVQWNSSSMSPISHFTGHSGGVRCILSLSPGRVWSGGDEGVIRVWDVDSGETVEELQRHTGSVLSLVTTGTEVWSASEDGTMCQWSLFPAITCLKQISTGPDRINTLLLVGTQVWSCGQDPRIHIWNSHTMDWLGSLRGHSRYLSAFVKVRCMETRIVWSYGLGEEHILVWRNESVADDAHDKYTTLLSQFTTQQDELDHLRARVALAEAAQRALEEARARERELFQKQLEDILLQLAQASAGSDDTVRALEQARKDIADLSAQNARLRNELRLHIEKLNAGEEIIRGLLQKIEVKDEHIESLQSDSLAQQAKFRARITQLESENTSLLTEKIGGDSILALLQKQLQESRLKNDELERTKNENTEAGLFYSAENTRLQRELAELTRSAQAFETSARLRQDHAAEQISSLEKHVLALTTTQSLGRAESDALRAENAALKAALHRGRLEKELADEQTRQKERDNQEARRKAQEDANTAAHAQKEQSRRIAALEHARSNLQGKLDEAMTTLSTVAREMKSVERNVYHLTKPTSEVYSAPRPQTVTFQHQALLRDFPIGMSPTPPPTFFNELSRTHSTVNRIMERCLDQTQKLHVGFTPAGVQHIEEVPEIKNAVRSITTTVPASSRPRTSPSTQIAYPGAGSSLRPISAASSPAHTRFGDVSIHDDTDDDGGEDTLNTNPIDSPVVSVWINGSGTAVDTPPSASLEVGVAPAPPSTPLSGRSTSRHTTTLPPTRDRISAPLISYDLSNIEPRSSLPSSSTRVPSSQLQSPLHDSTREQKLLQLETATYQRKVALRREKERREIAMETENTVAMR